MDAEGPCGHEEVGCPREGHVGCPREKIGGGEERACGVVWMPRDLSGGLFK